MLQYEFTLHEEIFVASYMILRLFNTAVYKPIYLRFIVYNFYLRIRIFVRYFVNIFVHMSVTCPFI